MYNSHSQDLYIRFLFAILSERFRNGKESCTATNNMTDHDTILFRGDDQPSIHLRVNGYSWADSEGSAELLSMTVRVENAPFSGGLTVDVGIGALSDFQGSLIDLLRSGKGSVLFETWEQDFKLSIKLDAWGQVEIMAKLNALEYVVEDARVTGVLASTVFTHPNRLEDSIEQLQSVLQAFPGRLLQCATEPSAESRR